MGTENSFLMSVKVPLMACIFTLLSLTSGHSNPNGAEDKLRENDIFHMVVTVRAVGSQFFAGQAQPVLVPDRGIFLRRRVSRARVAKLGTGFIFTVDGHILTTAHTLKGLEQVEIVFRDGSKASGKILAVSGEKDIAVLQAILPEGFRVPEFASSKDVSAGQTVFALNNPRSGDSDIVTGQVSRIDKTVVLPEQKSFLEDIIEIDLKVEVGSSGGPILNAAGQIIGMAMAGRSFPRDSLYALPVKELKEHIGRYL